MADRIAGTGVTVGGGADFVEVYQFAEANNVTVVGGSSRSVGAAGGWLTGGGHGALSNYCKNKAPWFQSYI
jgi:hypothetical protein